MAGLLGTLEDAMEGTQLMSVFQPVAEKELRESGNQAQDAMDRARGVEQDERKFCLETLERARELRKSGVSETNLSRFFRRREIVLAGRREEDFDSTGDLPSATPEFRAGLYQGLSGMQKAARLTAEAEDLLPEKIPDELRFHAEFFASDQFTDNWKDELAEANLVDLGMDPATGKDAEDCWRHAVLKTVGLTEKMVESGHTFGSWLSPEGNEYEVEVMSEFSKTAFFDLIMRIKDKETGEVFLVTNQHKSTKRNTQRKSLAPDANRQPSMPDSLSVKLTEISGEDRYSLEHAADEFQIRMLSNGSITDTSPHVQYSEGKMWYVKHTSQIVLPQVHRAIARHPNLLSCFRPETKTDKDTGEQVLRIRSDGSCRLVGYVPIPGLNDEKGKPLVTKLKTSVCVSLKNGKPQQDSQGEWTVDKVATGQTSGEVGLDVPKQAWLPLHRTTTAGKVLLESMLDLQDNLKEELVGHWGRLVEHRTR